MRSDPRIGLAISLLVAGLGMAWLLALAGASDVLFARLGTGMHAVTFISIFVVAAALATALLFRRFLSVRDELLGGREVLARWHVDRATWDRFAAEAGRIDDTEKRGVLVMIWVAVVVICGGLALALPRDAWLFGAIGAGIAAMVGAAFLLGRRIHRAGHVYRTGDVVVGRRGLIVNDMLHVWDVWLSWLCEAELTERPVPMLRIAYSWWTMGFGPQGITVNLPVPAAHLATARRVAAEIAWRSRDAGKGRRRGMPPARGRRGTEPDSTGGSNRGEDR